MDEHEKMQTQLGLFEVDARLTDLLRRIEENRDDDHFRSLSLVGGAALVAGIVLMINFKNKCSAFMSLARGMFDRPVPQAGVVARPPVLQSLPLYRSNEV